MNLDEMERHLRNRHNDEMQDVAVGVLRELLALARKAERYEQVLRKAQTVLRSREMMSLTKLEYEIDEALAKEPK